MKKVLIILTFFVTSIGLNKTFAQSEFSNGVIQVGVVVEDLEKSIDFYTRVLGMVKVSDFSVDKDFAKRSGLTGGVPFFVEVLKLEDSPNATQWKLMSFKKEANHPKPTFIQDDTGMQYITIFVNSLKPFIHRIEKYDVRLLGETPTKLNDENHFVFIQDPDGTFIELIGPME